MRTPTPRQVEVLRAIADGLTNPQAAEALFLHEQTIKNHLRNLYERTGAKNAPHAVAMAYEQDWWNDLDEAKAAAKPHLKESP